MVNSHADSPFAARARSGFGATGVRTLLVYGGALAASFAATNASNATLHVLHDSIDFTAAIALLEWEEEVRRGLGPFDRIFYAHDTVEVHDPRAFSARLREHAQVRTCSLQMGQSMNMGIYAMSDLRREKGLLSTILKGPDRPSAAQRAALKERGRRGWEGILFHRAGAWARFERCGCELSGGPNASRERLRLHGSARVALHYPEWGIAKYQTARLTTSLTSARSE